MVAPIDKEDAAALLRYGPTYVAGAPDISRGSHGAVPTATATASSRAAPSLPHRQAGRRSAVAVRSAASSRFTTTPTTIAACTPWAGTSAKPVSTAPPTALTVFAA